MLTEKDTPMNDSPDAQSSPVEGAHVLGRVGHVGGAAPGELGGKLAAPIGRAAAVAVGEGRRRRRRQQRRRRREGVAGAWAGSGAFLLSSRRGWRVS